MFRLMFVHFTFSSVMVAEWPSFGNSCPFSWTFVLIAFCLFVIFIFFLCWFYELALAFDCSSSCSLLFYYLF